MGWYFGAVLMLQGVVSVQCFLHLYPKIELGPRDDGDPGTPLFLTPYIESGNISEAKRLARVHLTEECKIKSFSGFFTVNKTYDSNQFFWYFPATDKNSTEAPVIVWLQGGPGSSSLFGLFVEHGPIYVHKGHFHKRAEHWAMNHHIIYIDNPVGTGFSFTNDSRGYCTDETQVGEQLYSTITQFFQLFPELQQNKFFVTGESYGGKYVPALAYTIHKKNPTAEVKINLKGIAIGNGWSDPEHQLLYSKYLYQIGLIDWNLARVTEENENKTIEYIRQGQFDNATDTLDNLLGILWNITGFDKFYYNLLFTFDYFKSLDFGPMLQKSCVRKAIHVGNLPFNSSDADGSDVVYNHLKQDFTKSVAPWVSELLDHYKVLIYNGQLDIVVAYPLTVNYLRNLKFAGSEEYKTAERHIWRVGKDVAGYTKRAGNLLEVLIRDAGHMAPADRPHWTRVLIESFTYDSPMDAHP